MEPKTGEIAEHLPLASPGDVHPSRLLLAELERDGRSWVIVITSEPDQH